MDVGQPELALGTVQLGLPYGIAGRGVRVSDDEARSILAAAHERGVRMLDTAAAYGDIEERLVGLFPPGRAFEVTSKIAPLPQEYTKVGADERALAAHVVACIDRSAQRLQGHLKTLLFHRAEDLDSPAGGMIWKAAHERTRALGVRLGVSLYEPDDEHGRCR